MRQQLLVVDDEDEVRAFLVHALEGSGYAVSAAPDGTSALQLFRERDFDLIVIDFALPGMTGAELGERIREHKPSQKLLLISGYAGTAALQRAAGDVPVVAKPIALKDLVAAVGALLDDQAERPARAI
jgi:CheY-like chemotaxis protein